MSGTHLVAGMPAPPFSLTDAQGTLVGNRSLRGQKYLLYFYPKDDTPGCTAQACSLRDGMAKLHKTGLKVYGISPDNAKKHQKFIDKYALPFPLLCDTEHLVAEAFGVWGQKKFMGKTYMGVFRTTFLIDENGLIRYVWKEVDTKNHAEQILNDISK